MKKLNKKGFTIVELVIVIAVIAILAGVMIPTFSGVIEKANESKALQEASNSYKQKLTEEPTNTVDDYIYFDGSKYYVVIKDGNIASDSYKKNVFSDLDEALGLFGNNYVIDNANETAEKKLNKVKEKTN